MFCRNIKVTETDNIWWYYMQRNNNARTNDEIQYSRVGSTRSRSTSDTSLLAALLVGEIYARGQLMMGLVGDPTQVLLRT